MNKKRDSKVGTLNQSKKNISNSLVRNIKRYQKHLQLQENIKYGRKAKHISFVYATKNVKGLANFIVGDSK